MEQALLEAKEAAAVGEVPVGAVIVSGSGVIARAHNLTEALKDVTAHAEMQAITCAADYLGGKYLPDCTLYVTLEPCAMCAAALGWAHIGRIVFGAYDPKGGFTTYFPAGSRSPLHPKTEITGGVMEEECKDLMQNFFRARRK